MWYLKSHDGKRMKKDIYHNMKLPAAEPSFYQKLIRKSHNSLEFSEFFQEQGYTVEYISDGKYKVTASQDAGDDEANDEGQKEYILARNHFNVCMKDKCACFCEKCGEEGLCFHTYTCTCPAFTGRNTKAIFHISQYWPSFWCLLKKEAQNLV